MLVKKLELENDKKTEKTIVLSQIEKNFIILDDNTYDKKEDIIKIEKMISKYYNTAIVSIDALIKILKKYIQENQIDFKKYTIVTVGQGGKICYDALNKEQTAYNMTWKRVWENEKSNYFMTNINDFDFQNKEIVLFEDVIATGETLYNIINEIEKKGGKVKLIVAAIINDGSPLEKKSFRKTIVALKVKDKDMNDPFWFPAIYSVRHLFYGDDEMPEFYKIFNEKYFDNDLIEKKIKKMRGENI